MDASIELALLRRTGKLVVADGAASTPLPLLTTLQQILEGLGYSLSQQLSAASDGLSAASGTSRSTSRRRSAIGAPTRKTAVGSGDVMTAARR